MTHPSCTVNLRPHRLALGFSQQQLAERVGISRQALIAIEGGRQVPSIALALQLARALRRGVEDLFALPRGPQLNAQLACAVSATTRVALGRVDGRWVAHAVAGGDRPAHGILTRPAPSPDTLAASAPRTLPQNVTVEPLCDATLLEQNVLVAGCAPLLGLLAERLGRNRHDARATWIPTDSSRALELLARGLVHIAGVHLAPSTDQQAHVRATQRVLRGQRATLLNLARWRQGFVIPKGNPLGISSAEDVLRPGMRCVRRQPGAAAQQLLEQVLTDAGQRAGAEAADGPIAADHADVARLVRWGVADVGVAIESVALDQGLDFIPISEERFDLLLPEARLQESSVARFLEQIETPSFQAEVARLPGYDLSSAGDVITIPSHWSP